MTTILLVDDQALVRTGIRTILESEPGFTVVGEAANGAEAVERAIELAPQVICMDVQMPIMDGLEATRALRDNAEVCASVLMLTTFDRDDFLFEALQAGASGFLLKTAEPEDIIDAVHALAQGDALLAPAVTKRVIESFASTPRAITPPPMLDGLTEREREILALIAKGLSNSEIAKRLFLGESTIKTHVSNVLAKLGLRDRVHAVIWSYEHGVVQPGAETAEAL
ncbi:response regulator [Humidisolicoccus flavus]|uniref:response regulator n=1 Tax=Humidisolicoccus flavus TaxID=3111414 RepID=UPI003251367E